eukprot:538840-Pleurochrysis_carterae.AAC.2
MAATDAKKVKTMRTSVGWFSSPSRALIYQCSKYVAKKGYAIGAKFRQWLDAELYGQEEKSFDNELLGSVEVMLTICGSRDYIFFIDAAVTERLLADRQLAHLPGGRGRSGRRAWLKAAQCDPHRLLLRGDHGRSAREGPRLRVLALDTAARDRLRRTHPR